VELIVVVQVEKPIQVPRLCTGRKGVHYLGLLRGRCFSPYMGCKFNGHLLM
jgi:hypothetical protein